MKKCELIIHINYGEEWEKYSNDKTIL